MLDRDQVARFPTQDFRLKQDSSYNRVSVAPEPPKNEPTGWFANNDYNTKPEHGRFIRIEKNQGREEFVLMEDEGPGAIVRTWMPWRKQTSGTTNAILRIYVDGHPEPVIEGNQFELFQGKGLVPFPLAHESLRSAVSFFPIPYAKGCKVTVSECPFFFQFTYREYDDEVPVKSFTMDDFEAARPLIDETCKSLLNPQDATEGKTFELFGTLAPNEERKVSMAEGVAAVRALSVKLADYSDPEITRKVVLKMSFDGKETVWCPIGDFFGCGIGLNPMQGWFRTVAEDGTMRSRWVMPYQKNATMSILNLSEKPVDVEARAITGEWTWSSESLYFHAQWRGQYPVPTRPFSDWNYVTIKGRGVYVGDTLTIMNPVEKWWGEGDERIYIDGEDFPSIFGTGTEDYYAYSWGGRSTDFYEHPFHAQPFCHKYNKLNRKTDSNERNTMGFSVETRSRALDTMPFGSSLQLDMEVWSGSDCEMGYQVGVYWYGDAETTSNRKPEPSEIPNVPELPAALTHPETATKGQAFDDAVGFEKLKVLSKPEGSKPELMSKGPANKQLHDQNLLLIRGAKVGDAIEFELPSQLPSAERLTLQAVQSFDLGVVQFSVNGKPSKKVDLFSPKPRASGPIILGDFEGVDGVHTIRVEVVGKNPKSRDTFIALDCILSGSAE
ncbi:glycoside hydrolase family 172 protein [Haloferula chungangensis]|uniref:Glycoside hydrolase family 172 protein n=2 Tax=Haloferula chungangensis TaxID=1048331 RepID=A0ABW2L826_9BACT